MKSDAKDSIRSELPIEELLDIATIAESPSIDKKTREKKLGQLIFHDFNDGDRLSKRITQSNLAPGVKKYGENIRKLLVAETFNKDQLKRVAVLIYFYLSVGQEIKEETKESLITALDDYGLSLEINDSDRGLRKLKTEVKKLANV